MSSSDDEIIAFLKASVLEENRQVLCSNLDPKVHYAYLRSKYVLSEEDEEVIEVQQVRKYKVHKMIDILMKKGVQGFDRLVISIIQEKTQMFLAETLNKAFEEKIKRLHVIRASNITMGTSPAESTEQKDPLNKLKHLSINTHKIMDLPSVTCTQMDKNNRKSATESDCWANSLSDLGVDTDKLPKPMMEKAESEEVDGKIESCENSFHEDLDDIKSQPDSMSSLPESNV